MSDLNNGKTLKELQQFPAVFTFKIVGVNNKQFEANVKKIFDGRPDMIFSDNISKNGSYISITATTEVWKYEELESLYKEISMLEGLKFYV